RAAPRPSRRAPARRRSRARAAGARPSGRAARRTRPSNEATRSVRTFPYIGRKSANALGGAAWAPGVVRRMTARRVVGACALLALLGIAVYLLFQIPWEFGVGGIVALAAILFAVGHDAPDAL